MERSNLISNGLIFIFLLISGIHLKAQDPVWPREMSDNSSKLVLYHPQVDDWQDFTSIDFRMAFMLTPLNKRPNVGVVSIHASTYVNTVSHEVLFYSMTVKEVYFPGIGFDSLAVLEPMVRAYLPAGKTISMTLDQVVACTPKTGTYHTVKVVNDPPVIFVSYKPAILMQTDGEPIYASTGTKGIDFIVNTNWPVFITLNDSVYYLSFNKIWLKSTSLTGKWSRTTTLPAGLVALKNNSAWKEIKEVLPPPAPATGDTVPFVFFSKVPAEIIVFNGPPSFIPVPGTSLQYAKNTDCNIFLKLPEKEFYSLFSGRWFRSSALQGPWVFTTDNLPSDFMSIPRSSPASVVLSSVPGTEDAKDAVLIAQIPTSVRVNPASADSFAHVTYNGEPKFQSIEGTTLSYATNTPDKVILVNGQYYLCLQGIWFVSPFATGPWTTAPSVPQMIYSIPPSCPVYNVTFVTQSTTPDGVVIASYTAGYMGVYTVSSGPNVTLCFGTGFVYPPFCFYPPVGFPIYYPCPVTYGFAACGYHPYTGMYYGASYNAATGTYARTATAYGPYGKTTVGQAYNPYTGTYARGGSVSTPYGTRSAGQAYNPYTGSYGQTRQGSSPYGQWGTSTVTNSHGESAVMGHSSTAAGTYGAAATSAGGKMVAGSGMYGTGAVGKTAGGDMYAAKDGNVYTNSGGNWSKASGSGFQSPQGGSFNSQSVSHQETAQQFDSERSQGEGSFDRNQSPGGDSFGNLNSEMDNRDRGSFQSDRFQQSGGWSGGDRSGSFGGFGGSGGFGGWGGRGGGGGGRFR